MPSAQRILRRLPSTFLPAPGLSPLAAIAAALGGELQNAENALAAVMAAHWVEHADRGAEVIDDLARLAALYGLAPRDDEDVEAYRDHLRRYVRTFLQGPSTVRGLIRVTAEALALNVADDDRVEYWWGGRAVRTYSPPRGDDAARAVLGFDRARVTGRDARAAQLTGTTSLTGDLRSRLGPAAVLDVTVDAGPPVSVDLGPGAVGAAPTLPDIVTALNAALAPSGPPVAAADEPYLTLRSPTSGAGSALHVLDADADAAPVLLGLPPRRYVGADATRATLVGSVALGVLDLTETRFLRVLLDGTQAVEVDCAGPDPAATTPEQVRDAINAAYGGQPVARLDDGRLVVSSPTAGSASRVAVESAAAQDAAVALLGAPAGIAVGQDPLPARLPGTPDLSAGVDLSSSSFIELSVDGTSTVLIDCAGTDPAATTPEQVRDAINAAVPGLTVTDGRTITLTSPTAGAASVIAVGEPDGDASQVLFGLRSRRATGTDTTTAQLSGSVDLTAGVDLLPAWALRLAIDGAAPVEADLRVGVADSRAATPAELAAAVNHALGAQVASVAADALVLRSLRAGSAGSVAVLPGSERVPPGAWTTRAPLLDEAAMPLLGFLSQTAAGTAARPAVLAGTVDLSAGVDLRRSRYVRVSLDGGAFVDVGVAGPRAGVTMPGDVAAALNSALAPSAPPVAHVDHGRVVLTSPTYGAGSRLILAAPGSTDALPLLLGTGPATVTGSDATGVRFRGVADLALGVDASGGAAIRLTVDGVTHDVDCAGANPVSTSAADVASAINAAFGAQPGAPIASRDGGRVVIASALTGPDAEVSFDQPLAGDGTMLLLGITSPRAYHGSQAATATLRGTASLPAEVDLSTARFLRVGIDQNPPVDIDCAAGAADAGHVPPTDIVARIDAVLGAGVATLDGGHLVLTSPTAGAAGRVSAQAYLTSDDDARPLVFGTVPDTARGADAQPARVTGDVVPGAAVDLGSRTVLRVVVDNDPPADIDVAGADPNATTPAEVVARVNTALPGTASLSPDSRLQLTSPATGPDSRIEVLPLRYVEVIEYLPELVTEGPREVRHGERIRLRTSAPAAPARWSVLAPRGAVAPGLARWAGGRQLRVLVVLQPGDRLDVGSAGDAIGGNRLAARITSPDGTSRPVPPGALIDAPATTWTAVPADRPVLVHPTGLALDDPTTPGLVVLRPRAGGVTVTAGEASLPAGAGPAGPSAAGGDAHPAVLSGRLPADKAAARLLDASGSPVADLVAGLDVDLAALAGRVVRLRGVLHPAPDLGGLPVLGVAEAAAIYDVVLQSSGTGREDYPGVTIGAADEPRSLIGLLTAPESGSALVTARPAERETLRPPLGVSDWSYLQAQASRYDAARLDAGRFAGHQLSEEALFDVARFHGAGSEVEPVFGGEQSPPPPSVVELTWTQRRPGTVAVNLPADLPAALGARFDAQRFAVADSDENYADVVLEPPSDPDYLATRVAAGAGGRPSLVTVTAVGAVPPGAPSATVPFRRPRQLEHGGPGNASLLYLQEATMAGALLISARSPGAWGDAIEISVRPSGPGRYSVTVRYAGAVFENARDLALGPPRSLANNAAFKHAPIGLDQARAAGVTVKVTRERADWHPGDPPDLLERKAT